MVFIHDAALASQLSVMFNCSFSIHHMWYDCHIHKPLHNYAEVVWMSRSGWMRFQWSWTGSIVDL